MNAWRVSVGRWSREGEYVRDWTERVQLGVLHGVREEAEELMRILLAAYPEVLGDL